jgi:hypothetical protein
VLETQISWGASPCGLALRRAGTHAHNCFNEILMGIFFIIFCTIFFIIFIIFIIFFIIIFTTIFNAV